MCQALESQHSATGKEGRTTLLSLQWTASSSGSQLQFMRRVFACFLVLPVFPASLSHRACEKLLFGTGFKQKMKIEKKNAKQRAPLQQEWTNHSKTVHMTTLRCHPIQEDPNKRREQ
eukprot:3969375-Amphidinium_carterae.1